MKRFFCVSFFLLIFFVNLNANQLNKFQTETPSLNQSGQISFQLFASNDNEIDYLSKSKKNKNLGIGGIFVLSIGFAGEIAGSVLFILGYKDMINFIFNGVPVSLKSTLFYYIGLTLMAVFDLMFLGGLAMTIVGFVLARYYEKKAGKVAVRTFIESNQQNLQWGFAFRF